MAHHVARLLAGMAILVTVLPVDTSSFRSAASAAGAPAVETLHEAVSLHPVVTVLGGRAAHLSRISDALARFEHAGLKLPDLDITISNDEADCSGHKGRFRSTTTPWQISVCSEVDSVYEHELAHAWERANLTDERRYAFMRLRGYEVWSGSEIPWNERGVEGVAFVIQQGLSDVPLAPALSDEARSRMDAFELLTDRPAPRLVRWMAEREVACPDRPTPLSHQVPDTSGTTCQHR